MEVAYLQNMESELERIIGTYAVSWHSSQCEHQDIAYLELALRSP